MYLSRLHQLSWRKRSSVHFSDPLQSFNSSFDVSCWHVVTSWLWNKLINDQYKERDRSVCPKETQRKDLWIYFRTDKCLFCWFWVRTTPWRGRWGWHWASQRSGSSTSSPEWEPPASPGQWSTWSPSSRKSDTQTETESMLGYLHSWHHTSNRKQVFYMNMFKLSQTGNGKLSQHQVVTSLMVFSGHLV